MISPIRKAIAPASHPLIGTAALLALGLGHLPAGPIRAARDAARSAEMNRADRESDAGGYYEGLIGGGAVGARSELALRLLGKPTDWVNFHDAGVVRAMPDDFLLFELLPDLDRELFGKPFTTNADGLRDVPYAREKPPGTFRIALLGSSMDMGWGVDVGETYENLLERWLNDRAAGLGLARRFEVLNFAVAAFGPAQRLESFRRKALGFDPDMVLYSATMLDPRLSEIHLCGLLQGRVDLRYDFLRDEVAEAGLTPDDLRLDAGGSLANKARVKAKLAPKLWPIADAALGDLVADCRSAGLPLACLIIPRVGKADAPGERADAVASHIRIAAGHGVPIVDLSATFDDEDPASIEIAAWDDHPNTEGHRLLFEALRRALVDRPELDRLLFRPEETPR